MGLLGDALESINKAARNLRTIDIVIFHRHDPGVRRRLSEAWRARSGMTRAHNLDTEVAESISRLWLQKPDRIRLERERLSGSGAFAEALERVEVGRDWWEWREGHHAVKGTMEPKSFRPCQFEGMLATQWIVPALRLEALDTATVCGRSGIRLRGTSPRGLEYPARAPDWRDHFTDGADEYELVVDRERGVLLFMESRFGGELLDVKEVRKVEFDAELPESTFVFVPKPGVAVEDEPQSRAVSLAEAAEQVPFPLLVPDFEPGRMFLRRAFLDFGGKHGCHVTMFYLVPSLQPPALEIWNLYIAQPAADIEGALGLPSEAMRIGGVEVRVHRDREEGVYVQWDRGDTSVTLAGTMDLDFAIEVIHALRPYEPGNP